MDRTKQVYRDETDGWRRGLYEDVQRTFRAPIVNSVWRVQLYHCPDFLRYAWGQIKPAFDTREFAALSLAVRDRLLSAVEDEVPAYDPAAVDISPGEFTELRGQVAAFDAVAPRLLVLFALMDRRLGGGSTGDALGDDRATTAPFPDWLDGQRGRRPTMASQEDAREAAPADLLDDFDEMVPSIYRVLAQWPSYLERAWDDLGPVFDGDAFAEARADVRDLVDAYLDRLPYEPQVDPETLSRRGFDDETVSELQAFYATFVEDGTAVVTTLPVYASTVDAAGEREGLTFPG